MSSFTGCRSALPDTSGSYIIDATSLGLPDKLPDKSGSYTVDATSLGLPDKLPDKSGSYTVDATSLGLPDKSGSYRSGRPPAEVVRSRRTCPAARRSV